MKTLAVALAVMTAGCSQQSAATTAAASQSRDREELESLVNASILFNRADADLKQREFWANVSSEHLLGADEILEKSNVFRFAKAAEDAHVVKYGANHRGLRSYPLHVIQSVRLLEHYTEVVVQSECLNAKIAAEKSIDINASRRSRHDAYSREASRASQRIFDALAKQEAVFRTAALQ